VISAGLVWLLFLLPKVVVNNEEESISADSTAAGTPVHAEIPETIQKQIGQLRASISKDLEKEKSAIFADSLADLYQKASKFDSAGWFSEEAASFFNTTESKIKAGDNYYQAFTFATDPAKQNQFAVKAREFYKEVLDTDPHNLDVKTRLAMTHISSSNPMTGILMLREVLAEDPENELALYNLGILSMQSGQYDKAVERFKELVAVNPDHTQGQLFLGVAYMQTGDRDHAKEQFEKVKKMDSDPAVQAAVDSYLAELK
jgi:tetratricopeptide (TPR) repeat protein